MVKPQATPSRKAGMNCTGEHISTAARSRRPDRRKGRSTTRRHRGDLWMQGQEIFRSGRQDSALKPLAVRPVRVDQAARERALI
jgi:hypothetical protein